MKFAGNSPGIRREFADADRSRFSGCCALLGPFVPAPFEVLQQRLVGVTVLPALARVGTRLADGLVVARWQQVAHAPAPADSLYRPQRDYRLDPGPQMFADRELTVNRIQYQ